MAVSLNKCIVLLVLTRLAEFFTPVVKKDMFVTSNMEVDPMINLNLDIVFPNCPCGGTYLLFGQKSFNFLNGILLMLLFLFCICLVQSRD